jgi:hypothetical protein
MNLSLAIVLRRLYNGGGGKPQKFYQKSLMKEDEAVSKY